MVLSDCLVSNLQKRSKLVASTHTPPVQLVNKRVENDTEGWCAMSYHVLSKKVALVLQVTIFSSYLR